MPGLTGHLPAVPAPRGREKRKKGPKRALRGAAGTREAQNRAEMPVCRTQPSAICSQTVIFGRFCRLNCRCLQPGRHFRALLMAEGAGRCSFAQRAKTGPTRSLDVSTPPHTVPAVGQARNVVEQVPSCRLRRHCSLLVSPLIPVSAHSLRNQRPRPIMPAMRSSCPACFCVMPGLTGHLMAFAVPVPLNCALALPVPAARLDALLSTGAWEAVLGARRQRKRSFCPKCRPPCVLQASQCPFLRQGVRCDDTVFARGCVYGPFIRV